jgi:hypothetical protein
MQIPQTESTVDKLWILAVGAVLGGALTFVYTRVSAFHQRRDTRRDHAAALCSRGLRLFDELSVLHGAWIQADAAGADAALNFLRTYRVLATPADVDEFVKLCRTNATFSHDTTDRLLALAKTIDALVERHESMRVLLSVPSKAKAERSSYSNAFQSAMRQLADTLYSVSFVAPSDSKRAVTKHTLLGATRGNA